MYWSQCPTYPKTSKHQILLLLLFSHVTKANAEHLPTSYPHLLNHLILCKWVLLLSPFYKEMEEWQISAEPKSECRLQSSNSFYLYIILSPRDYSLHCFVTNSLHQKKKKKTGKEFPGSLEVRIWHTVIAVAQGSIPGKGKRDPASRLVWWEKKNL